MPKKKHRLPPGQEPDGEAAAFPSQAALVRVLSKGAAVSL